MGGNDSKPKAPQPTIDDVIIDMRLTAKRFESESRRCEREKNQLLAKAKQALQKNNEEGAKLYLTSAMNKQKEAENLQRMSHKMDALQGQIKSTTNQTATMNSISKITPLLNQHTQNMPIEQIYANMTQFETAMDAMMVEGKVMDQMMNKNADVSQDFAVDQMMNNLKEEMNNQVSNDLHANPQMLFNELNQPKAQVQQGQINPNYK